MIKKEIINGEVFIEQTTYYIYKNEKDMKKDKPLVVTGDKKIFEILKGNNGK